MEREVTGPVDLCGADGRVAPQAIGWSRQPLQRAAIPGHWGRRKRWHHWAVTTQQHLVTVTFADLDYLGMVAVYVLDFATGKAVEKVAVRPLGWRVPLPDDAAGGDVVAQGMGLDLAITGRAGRTHIAVRSGRLDVDLWVTTPPGHETLNVVVPFPGANGREFQLTSKQTALPAEGEVRAGDRRYHFGPDNDAFATLDFGRGVWPRRTRWNWAAGAGRQGDHVIGLNFGAQWTDGSGISENGVTVDGRLHKLEDVRFVYDRRDHRRPWAFHGEGIDLGFAPFADRKLRLELGIAAARLDLAFGRFSGRVLGHEVRGLVGWAEELTARW